MKMPHRTALGLCAWLGMAATATAAATNLICNVYQVIESESAQKAYQYQSVVNLRIDPEAKTVNGKSAEFDEAYTYWRDEDGIRYKVDRRTLAYSARGYVKKDSISYSQEDKGTCEIAPAVKF